MPGLAIALSLLLALATGPAPVATLTAEQKAPPGYRQGIARVADGWILLGNFALGRFDDRLREQRTNADAIPRALKVHGYIHLGDGDVVGRYLYAPIEQGNFELGTQVTARYDARTLRFVDSVELPQHENSFVTVDPATMIAYSMDRFDGSSLLRYDVRGHWKPLAPLVMDATVTKVQGADVAAGAVWLSTTDLQNGLFRVDLRTGHVVALGSAGHVGGEGEGIDATKLASGRIHALTIDPKMSPIWLGHFAVSP